MSLWIKICANTSLTDAQLAAEAGADAVGFVFAPSPRRVTAEQVAQIVPQLPAALEKIGVFVDASLDEIATTVEAAGLTGVQLHFDAPPALPAQLREKFGPKLRILGVLHFDARAEKRVAAIARDEHIDALLVDSRTAAAVGGTGVAFDWDTARGLIFDADGPMKFIAAGGLTPENVAEAIATLRPWGVDVVSGVEAAPGRKVAAKVRAFVANARAAGGDASFREKVQEALDDPSPDVPHEQVEAQFAKRRNATLVSGQRLEDLIRFYLLLSKLEERIGGERILEDCSADMSWPDRGVYFFREPGEIRTDSGVGPRVVRVGTHAIKTGAKTSLWSRLRAHKSGTQNSSIFRYLVGQAWERRMAAKSDPQASELSVEQEVSQIIGKMPFLWLPIDDEAGPKSKRADIERNSIALLSNYNRPQYDSQSAGWLGGWSVPERVKKSGLWNQRHIEAIYDPAFLDTLEALIDSM